MSLSPKIMTTPTAMAVRERLHWLNSGLFRDHKNPSRAHFRTFVRKKPQTCAVAPCAETASALSLAQSSAPKTKP